MTTALDHPDSAAPPAAADPPPPETAALAAAARAAQREWACVPLRRRLAVIRGIRHRLAADPERFADAARAGRSDPRAEKLVGEVLPLADACFFLESQAAAILAPRRCGSAGRPMWLSGVTSEVRREPLGVVLLIAPSNFPLMLAGVQAVQALTAGNAVIWKPGLGGTASAEAFAEAAVSAGLDRRLLAVLPETAAAAQEAVDAGVDKVFLTGSARAGSAVMERLAATLTPSVMELSGCDPVFVLPGADPDLVARAVKSGLRFNGSETCIAPRRVFVARPQAADLESRLRAAAESIEPRPVRPAAAAFAEALVGEAVSAGARRLTGRLADDPPGLLSPTVVADVRPPMRLLREDVFAPVVSVCPVADADEALRLAADCPYALGASVFGPQREAVAFAARVRAGGVTVNDLVAPTADPRLPFGGLGRSGFGVTRGPEGLLEMTATKVVAVRRGSYQHLEEPTPGDAEFFAAYIRAAHSPGWFARLGWAARLVRLAARRLWGGGS
jgi:acyl-CoA reductase-like NAD-dependent aldehyde dehydrogenase